jgi:hypothetical protein
VSDFLLQFLNSRFTRAMFVEALGRDTASELADSATGRRKTTVLTGLRTASLTMTMILGALNSPDNSCRGNDDEQEERHSHVLQLEVTHGTNPDIKASAGQTVAARQQELQKARALAK